MTEKIKLLFLLEPTAYAGAEKIVVNLINNFDDKLFDITIAVDEKFKPMFQKDIRKKINWLEYQVDPTKKFSWTRWREISKIDINQYDIVSTHQNMPLFYAVMNKKTCRLIHTQHIEESWRTNFWPDRQVADKINQFVAVSSEVKTFLEQEKGAPSDKITTIFNGIETDRLKINRLNYNFWKKHYDIYDDETVIGFAGRLTTQKDMILWLKIVQLMKDRKKLRWIIVGDGEQKAELESIIQHFKLPVNLAGWQRNPVDHLQLFDIFLNTSLYEGMPTAILEALACGNYVVSTDVGGIKDIAHFCSGVHIVDNRSEDALVEKIGNLTNSRIGRNQPAQEQVDKYFSARQMAGQYLELMKKVLKY